LVYGRKILMAKEQFDQYADGDITAIQLIRNLAGIFKPEGAISILAHICLICRVEQGELSKETYRSLIRNHLKEDYNEMA
jgi:hypothetical protein